MIFWRHTPKILILKSYLHNSIIIISSDHGQEFNDNHQNFWGHSGNFTKFQTKVPLVIHWPNQSSKQVQYVTTSYDLIPTLLQNQFGCTNSVNDYSIGQNLLKNVDRRSFIITGSYTNMGLIESDRITTLNASGQISITDLIAKPTVNTKIRSDTFKKALSLMRKYSLTNKTN